MDAYAKIDETSFPVVRVAFTGKKSSDENFELYLRQLKDCYRFEKRIAIIFDATNASVPAMKHQKKQAQWLKENEELMRKYCAGTAYVIPNAAIRAILKMIFSFQKQPVPYQVVQKVDEAEGWIKSLILD
jgi:hypothetical protein